MINQLRFFIILGLALSNSVFAATCILTYDNAEKTFEVTGSTLSEMTMLQGLQLQYGMVGMGIFANFTLGNIKTSSVSGSDKFIQTSFSANGKEANLKCDENN